MNTPQTTSTTTKQSAIDAAILTAERISARLQTILDRLPVDFTPAQQSAWFHSETLTKKSAIELLLAKAVKL